MSKYLHVRWLDSNACGEDVGNDHACLAWSWGVWWKKELRAFLFETVVLLSVVLAFPEKRWGSNLPVSGEPL